MKLVSGALVLMTMLGGCAEKSADISASYVSPLQYQSLSCKQLQAEAQRLSGRAAQAMGAQDKKASNDATATAVGLVLFWPALFFIKGGSETSAEVARLKGEMDAIEQESIRKNCGIQFQKPTPVAPKPATPSGSPEPTVFK
ncbi:MAG: hypothetical protein Q7J57_06450 [Gemmobacter sp.]|nr:hypothetical protein [Gemmobacter sp.]